MREGRAARPLGKTTGHTETGVLHGGNPLKRVLALTALLLSTVAAVAVPASASTACLNVHVDINGTVVDQAPCV